MVGGATERKSPCCKSPLVLKPDTFEDRLRELVKLIAQHYRSGLGHDDNALR